MISYETYALVRDIVAAHPLPPITMKGISREVVPYAVEGMLDAAGEKIEIFSEHMTGLDFYLDPTMVDTRAAEHIKKLLQNALKTHWKRRVSRFSRGREAAGGRNCSRTGNDNYRTACRGSGAPDDIAPER